MSADNWDTCPRCLDGAKREANDAARLAREAADAVYGTAPVDEYRKLDRAAIKAQEAAGSITLDSTFREDYEIWIEGGNLEVRYKGSCRVCGLGHSFKHTGSFYDAD